MIARVKAVLQRFHRLLFSHIQSGANVLCSVCGWHGRQWMTGRCPRCDSLARHRLIPYSISHFGLDLSRGALLHVGPNIEEAAYVFRRFAPIPYHRLDLVNRPIVNLTGDLCAIPLAEASMEHVLIWHVLEHIPDDRKAIAEIYRVLRPGGKLLAYVPITPPGRAQTYEDASVPREEYEKTFGHDDHVRACGLDYADRFRAAGFDVSTLNVSELPANDAKLFGLSAAHVAWCGTK